MTSGTHPRRAVRRGVARLALVALALGLAVPVAGSAHPSAANGYQDSFDSLGALPSSAWDIKSGGWVIADQPVVAGVPASGTRRVLQQTQKLTPPNDPIAFVKGHSFRAFTAQVTAAIMEGDAVTDPAPGASVGIAFRAPVAVETGLADKDNLYLFSAIQTGIQAQFTTGKSFALFKRVGRGYYLLNTKLAQSWLNLREAHQYKVIMTGGHIQAFVDGRLVIDHTDIPSPDQPTIDDPFPGLPFDSGAVGLRSSGARVWFDDFSVTGADAYESRAAAFDAYYSYGRDIRTQQTGGRVFGVAGDVQTQLAGNGLSKLDTGYQLHGHDFDEASVRPADVNGQQPTVGVTLRTVGSSGTVTSTARIAGLAASFSDPTQHVSVSLNFEAIEAVASSTCTTSASRLNIANGTVTVRITNTGQAPDTVIGPFPLNSSYKPDTVILEDPGLFKLSALATRTSRTPQRIEASALKLTFPESLIQPATGVSLGVSPAVEISIADVAAGMYCS